MLVKKIIFFLIIVNFSLNHLFSIDGTFNDQLKIKNESYKNLIHNKPIPYESLGIDPHQLSELIGLNFSRNNADSFHVIWKNERGDAFGIASFYDPQKKYADSIYWFWDVKDGFYEIFKPSDLEAADFGPLYISKLFINENGVVIAGYYQSKFLLGNEVDKRASWLSWSKEKGLFLHPITNEFINIYDINDQNYVLIKTGKSIVGNDRQLLKFDLINAIDPSDIICLGNPIQKIREMLIEDWKNKNEFNQYDPTFLHVSFDWRASNCYLDNDCNIKGWKELILIRFSWRKRKKDEIRHSSRENTNISYVINSIGDCSVSFGR